ncbi:hypothetical protein LINPERHAP2_LOCUS8399 [Linum perenne]
MAQCLDPSWIHPANNSAQSHNS